jgi:hypothetical protein
MIIDTRKFMGGIVMQLIMLINNIFTCVWRETINSLGNSAVLLPPLLGHTIADKYVRYAALTHSEKGVGVNTFTSAIKVF